jgi:hypothetical protein
MKPGERSELAESEQSERCQWSELGMESEGRSKRVYVKEKTYGEG